MDASSDGMDCSKILLHEAIGYTLRWQHHIKRHRWMRLSAKYQLARRLYASWARMDEFLDWALGRHDGRVRPRLVYLMESHQHLTGQRWLIKPTPTDVNVKGTQRKT